MVLVKSAPAVITAVLVLAGMGCGAGAADEAATARGAGSFPPSVVRADLSIRGMTCGACATTAVFALKRSPGVHDATASYESARGAVWYDSTVTSTERIVADLARLTGYEASVLDEGSESDRSPS